MVECGVFFDKPYSRGANTPHLNPLPYTTTGLLREYDAQRVVGLRSIRLGSPPRGEEDALALRRAMARQISCCATQRDPHIRFCDTNPPFWKTKYCGTSLWAASYEFAKRFCRWVRFGKRTHRGGCFREVGRTKSRIYGAFRLGLMRHLPSAAIIIL